MAVVRTRDDLGVLTYSARGVVVGRADELAGLQFPEVVIAGLGDASLFESREHRRQAFMSSLYLAVSRASERVTIVLDEENFGIPAVLQSAAAQGIVDRSL